jgi:hypothetical protein
MATNPVECPERVESETLSALRDDLLSGDVAARLREHVPSCAACQARLYDYDEVARALLRQRELEPGERILRGVRRRVVDGRAARRIARRRLWSGLGGLASVAAVLLLFLYVFGQNGGSGPTHPGTPTASRGPSVTASATATTTTSGPFQVADPTIANQLNIAYVQNNDVWIGLRGARPTQATHLGLTTPDSLMWRLVWSADESELLATANDDAHAATVAPRAWIIATATKAVTALPQATSANLGGGCEMTCSWLGDRYIAHANPTAAATHYLVYQIYDTQTRRDLTTALDKLPVVGLETRGAAIYFSPYAVSPGPTPGTISRFDLASNTITPSVFTAPGPLVSQGLPAANWDISSDGSSIVYEFGFGLSTRCPSPPCYTYYQDRSGAVTALYPGYQSQAAAGTEALTNLVISPDGRTAAVLFGSSTPTPGGVGAVSEDILQQPVPDGAVSENALTSGNSQGWITGWTTQTPGVMLEQPRYDSNGSPLSTTLYFAPSGGSGNARLVESLALPVNIVVSIAASA